MAKMWGRAFTDLFVAVQSDFIVRVYRKDFVRVEGHQHAACVGLWKKTTNRDYIDGDYIDDGQNDLAPQKIRF